MYHEGDIEDDLKWELFALLVSMRRAGVTPELSEMQQRAAAVELKYGVVLSPFVYDDGEIGYYYFRASNGEVPKYLSTSIRLFD